MSFFNTIKPAYYNEVEPFLCQWLRSLIAAGHLPPGEVDERSIVDVQPDDLRGFRQVHLFAGLGGWGFAARLAGWPDDRELWSASLPCQPFSVAGSRRGVDDPRHLAPEFLRLSAARKPAVAVGEQVASKAGRAWLAALRAEMEALGYATGGADLCAAGVGAWHIRQRLYWVAYAERDEQPRQEPRRRPAGRVGRIEQPVSWHGDSRLALAGFRANGDGLPRCVEGTDAARNAIVPGLAAEFLAAVMECAP